MSSIWVHWKVTVGYCSYKHYLHCSFSCLPFTLYLKHPGMTACIDDSFGQLHSSLQSGGAIIFLNDFLFCGAKLICNTQIKFLEVVLLFWKRLIHIFPNFSPKNIVTIFVFPPVVYDNSNYSTLFPTLGCSLFFPFLIPKAIHAHIKNKQTNKAWKQ